MRILPWCCVGSIAVSLCARVQERELLLANSDFTEDTSQEDYYTEDKPILIPYTKGKPILIPSRRSLRIDGTRIRKLFENKSQEQLELSAVVVTIHSGTSYDELFQKVPQEGVEGSYVATYSVKGSVKPIFEALTQNISDPDLAGLLRDLDAVSPSSVVFNWECDSRFSEESFSAKPVGRRSSRSRQIQRRKSKAHNYDLDLVALLIKRGHMVMFSDFSLKALIKEWNEQLLGPNPFVKVGEISGSMQLVFDSQRVLNCPSAQLQRAAELSPTASVHVMYGTIAFTVNSTVPSKTKAYSLNVLSVARKMSGVDVSYLSAELICKAGDQQGAAGHVILEYPSGGTLLASAGHWIELSKLDGVTEDRLLEVAEYEYGRAQRVQWMSEINAKCGKRSACRSKETAVLAKKLVQQTPASSRSGMAAKAASARRAR